MEKIILLLKLIGVALFMAALLIVMDELGAFETPKKVEMKEIRRFNDGRVVYIIHIGEHEYSCSAYGNDYEYASAEHAEDCLCNQ